jgi:hypothetical protein
MLHLFDETGFNPWVPAIAGKRNPVTLRMEWVQDPTVPLTLSAPPRRVSEFSFWGRTDWGAISGRASCTARKHR